MTGIFDDIGSFFDRTSDTMAKALEREGVELLVLDGLIPSCRRGCSNLNQEIQSCGLSQREIFFTHFCGVRLLTLSSRLNTSRFYAQGHVDDIALMIGGKYLKTISGLLKGVVDFLKEW